MRKAAAISALCLAAGAGAAKAAGTVEAALHTDRYIPVAEQRDALDACRLKMGLRGRVTFSAVWQEPPAAGQTVLRVVPGARVTSRAAQAINACADQALGRPGPRVRTVRSRKAQPDGCPDHAAVIHGGARYCVGN